MIYHKKYPNFLYFGKHGTDGPMGGWTDGRTEVFRPTLKRVKSFLFKLQKDKLTKLSWYDNKNNSSEMESYKSNDLQAVIGTGYR